MKRGDKVTYVPKWAEGDPDFWQHGMIKNPTPDGEGFFVVYHCNGLWDRYDEYTGCNTKAKDLKEGWLDIEAYRILMPQGERIGR